MAQSGTASCSGSASCTAHTGRTAQTVGTGQPCSAAAAVVVAVPAAPSFAVSGTSSSSAG